MEVDREPYPTGPFNGDNGVKGVGVSMAPPPPALPDASAEQNPVQKKLEALERLKALKFNTGGLKTDLSIKSATSMPFNYEPVRKMPKLDLMALQGAIAANSIANQISPSDRRRKAPYKSWDEPSQEAKEVDLMDTLWDNKDNIHRGASYHPGRYENGFDEGRRAAAGGGQDAPTPLLAMNLGRRAHSPQASHNYREPGLQNNAYENMSPSRPRYSQPVIERYRGRPKWFDIDSIIQDPAIADTNLFDRWNWKGLKDLVEELSKKETDLVASWKQNDQEVNDLQEILARELRELSGCRLKIDEQTRERERMEREDREIESTINAINSHKNHNLTETKPPAVDSPKPALSSMADVQIRSTLPNLSEPPPSAPISSSSGLRFPPPEVQVPAPGQLMALLNARLALPMKKPEPSMPPFPPPHNVQLPFAPRPPPPMGEDMHGPRPGGPPPPMIPPPHGMPPMRPRMPPPPNFFGPPPGSGGPPLSGPPPHRPGGPPPRGPPPQAGPVRLLGPRFRMPMNVRLVRPSTLANKMKQMKMLKRQKELRGQRGSSPQPLNYAVPLTPEYEGNEPIEGELEDIDSPGDEDDDFDEAAGNVERGNDGFDEEANFEEQTSEEMEWVEKRVDEADEYSRDDENSQSREQFVDSSIEFGGVGHGEEEHVDQEEGMKLWPEYVADTNQIETEKEAFERENVRFEQFEEEKPDEQRLEENIEGQNEGVCGNEEQFVGRNDENDLNEGVGEHIEPFAMIETDVAAAEGTALIGCADEQPMAADDSESIAVAGSDTHAQRQSDWE